MMNTIKRLLGRSYDAGRSALPLIDGPPAPNVLDAATYGGIGRANIYPPPGRGAVVMVSALSLYEGDIVTLYWHDTVNPVETRPVPPGLNSPMQFDVPADLLRVTPPFPPDAGSNTGDNVVVDVWYTIYRPFPQETFTSAPARVTVDWLIPGDPDPDQTTPYVNENLTPLVLPSPIVPTVDLVLTVPRWANAAIGDRLFVAWGTSQFVAATLVDTSGDAGPDVTITIPWQIMSLGGDNVVVTYYILDAVSNHSLWAPSVKADVETGNRLPAPSILDLDDYDHLDADALAGSPGRVNVRYPAPTAGDIVVLTWTGRTREGIALPEFKLDYTIPQPAPSNHTFAIPYPQIQALIGGTARASYSVTTGSDAARPSLSAVADVVGTAMSLPAPSVREAVGSVIDPSGTATAIVRTDYPFMRPTDYITLLWQGTPVTGAPITDQQVKLAGDATTGELSFVIPANKLLNLAGGSVLVSYTVLATGDVSVPSETLAVTVDELVAEDLVLPAPTVEGTSGTSLDLQNVADPIIVRTQSNAGFNAKTDIVDIAWVGIDGSLISGQPQLADPAGVSFSVPRDVALKDVGRTVNVYYSYVRTGSAGRLSEPRSLALVDSGSLPAPNVAQAVGTTLDALALPGGTFTVTVPATADVLATDGVTATVQGTDGTGKYTSPSQAGAKGMVFTLPATSLAPHLGKPIRVLYTRTRSGTATVSDLLELSVLGVGESAASLPTPGIFQSTASGTVVDLGNFAGDAAVTVAVWPLMAVGQCVWLRADGKADNGSLVSEVLSNGTPVVSTELTIGLNRALPRIFLDKLGDGTTLTITCKVTLDSTSLELNAVTFPVATFRVEAKEATPPLRFEITTPMELELGAPPGDIGDGGDGGDGTSLSIDTTDMSLGVGEFRQRKASGGTDVWYSADGMPVTVDRNTGMVRGEEPGTGYIQAHSGKDFVFYKVIVH
jgi:hypothetical protein